MKKSTQTPLALAIGGTLATGLSASTAQAEISLDNSVNPFTISELSNGYMQTAEADKNGSDKMKGGSCGEGKCGGAMQKGSEEKTAEGNCAGNKPMPKGKDGKSMEGKCGEGKCGSSM